MAYRVNVRSVEQHGATAVLTGVVELPANNPPLEFSVATPIYNADLSLKDAATIQADLEQEVRRFFATRTAPAIPTLDMPKTLDID